MQRLSEASASVGKVYNRSICRAGTPHDWREFAIYLSRLISEALRAADAAAAVAENRTAGLQGVGPTGDEAGGGEGLAEDDAISRDDAAAEPEEYVKFTAPNGPAVRVLQKALAFVERGPPRKATALVEPFRARNLVGH